MATEGAADDAEVMEFGSAAVRRSTVMALFLMIGNVDVFYEGDFFTRAQHLARLVETLDCQGLS